jgi:putative restriction endonuclease
MSSDRESNAGRGKSYSEEDILAAIGDQRLGTREIADIVGCHRSTAYERLEELEERNLVQTTEVGRTLMWTRTSDRQLFVFSITAARMPDYENAVKTPVLIPQERISEDDLPETLNESQQLRVWTLLDEEPNQSIFDQLQYGDNLLFYCDDVFIGFGQIGKKFVHTPSSVYAFNTTVDQSYEEYKFGIVINEFNNLSIPRTDLWEQLGYDLDKKPIEPHRVDDQAISRLLTFGNPSTGQTWTGSVTQALWRLDTGEVPLLTEFVDQAQTRLYELADAYDPLLTEPDRTEYELRARDEAFMETVVNVYNHSCAFCGEQSEGPDGSPEVEATYIYPRDNDGMIDIRNGLALCKSHQWAFNVDWIAISDDHRVLVRPTPEGATRNKLEPLADKKMVLPDNPDYHPHPTFLRAHRDLFHEIDWSEKKQ